MRLVCDSCGAEHQVTVLQSSYRRLPCRACGSPMPLGPPRIAATEDDDTSSLDLPPPVLDGLDAPPTDPGMAAADLARMVAAVEAQPRPREAGLETGEVRAEAQTAVPGGRRGERPAVRATVAGAAAVSSTAAVALVLLTLTAAALLFLLLEQPRLLALP